eukprot:4076671-Alexandrium_andersonii.AAC.1
MASADAMVAPHTDPRVGGPTPTSTMAYAPQLRGVPPPPTAAFTPVPMMATAVALPPGAGVG